MFGLFATLAYAQETTGTPTSAPGGGISEQIILLIAIFGIFYFLLIRPQQQQRKKHQMRLSLLKKGDHVITAGGIHGHVIGVKDAIVVLKIAEVAKENVKIEVQKATISAVLDDEGEAESKSE
ncbi:MAG TPA: preprotein translocase subunit YajC [bacterium]|nr:preprotein translocase subunit YajC [bacterium]